MIEKKRQFDNKEGEGYNMKKYILIFVLIGLLLTFVSVGCAESNETPSGEADYTLSITTEELSVNVKKQLKLSTEVKRSDGTNAKNIKLVWGSADESIAKISPQGVVTGVSAGQVTITCSIKDEPAYSTTAVITVLQPIQKLSTEDKNLVLFPDDPEIGKQQVQYTIEPENASNQVLKWETNKSDIATVDQNGIITAHSCGDAIIKATTTDGTKKTIQIKVHIPAFYIPEKEIVITSVYGKDLDIQLAGITRKDLKYQVKTKDSAFDFDLKEDADSRTPHIEPQRVGEGTITFTYKKDKAVVSIKIEDEAISIFQYVRYSLDEKQRKEIFWNASKEHFNDECIGCLAIAALYNGGWKYYYDEIKEKTADAYYRYAIAESCRYDIFGISKEPSFVAYFHTNGSAGTSYFIEKTVGKDDLLSAEGVLRNTMLIYNGHWSDLKDISEKLYDDISLVAEKYGWHY